MRSVSAFLERVSRTSAGRRKGEQRNRPGKLARQEERIFYLFASPWIVGFVLWTLGPMLASLGLSFTKYDAVQTPEFVGLGNYIYLLHNNLFWTSLRVTVTYSVLAIPLVLVCSFGLALLLNQRLPLLSLWRSIYYLPAVTSGVAVSLLWAWIFQPHFGILNGILATTLHIQGPEWLADPTWVLPAFVIMALWGIGGPMLIYLSGLQGIPTDLYEAAELDGAGALRKFWHVTVPMMTPVVLFNLIMGIIGSFQIFTPAYVMTQGGPDYHSYFYVYYLYQSAFQFFQMGIASAQAWILFLIVLMLTLLTFKLSGRFVYYAAEVQ